MKEIEAWKVAIAEGVKDVKKCGLGHKNVRVKTVDRDTGVEILKVIKQNISHIPPGSYKKISGDNSNCRDFTIHFGAKSKAKGFINSINGIIEEYGDYVNSRNEYAVSETESGKDGKDGGDSPNSMINIILVIFVAAIAYYLWKQAG